MRLPFAARLYRTIGDEVEMFSVGRDVRIRVLVLAGERRNLRLGPIAVLITRHENGPTREIWRQFEKIHFMAVGHKGWVRFVIAG